MSPRAIVVPPGQGHRTGNVEFLARTADTPRFNFAIIEIVAGRALDEHVHDAEDDAFTSTRPPASDRRIGLSNGESGKP